MESAEETYGELVTTTMRVMSSNVWGRFGPWEQRASRILRVISDSAPDVILPQESWIDVDGGEQGAVFADALEMHHCGTGGDLLSDDGGPANAVLSRWPIAEHRVAL